MILDSYVTMSDASDYFYKNIGWDLQVEIDSSVQERLLVTSSQRIDNQLFIGVPTDSSQSLQQPRKIDDFIQTYNSKIQYEYDIPLFQWLKYNIDENTVPDMIKKAVLEYSLYLVMSYPNIQFAIDSQIFDAIDAGGMFSVRFKTPLSPKSKPIDSMWEVPIGILRIIAPVLLDNVTYEIQKLLVNKQLDIKQISNKLNMGNARVIR